MLPIVGQSVVGLPPSNDVHATLTKAEALSTSNDGHGLQHLDWDAACAKVRCIEIRRKSGACSHMMSPDTSFHCGERRKFPA